MRADHITERDVLALWLTGAARRGTLRTEDGIPVLVDFAGIPSAHAGPDLTAARLTIGGEPRRGDVEIHLTPDGWRAHGHDHDGAYANVILHVALWRGTGRAGRIPELILSSHLHEGVWAAVRRVRGLTAAPAPRDADRDGAARFARRVERYRLLLRYEEADRLHFVETMKALGYGPNKAAFVELARRAGADPAAWGSLRLPWNLQGVRPANHPSRRLRQIERYVRAVPRPFEELCGMIRGEPDDGALVRALAARFGLGRERSMQIVFNIDLPMAATRREFADRLARIEAAHPPLASTRPSRLMGEGAATVRGQMGLIERHRRLGGRP